MHDQNLKNVETHYAFGKNWDDYSNLINDERIEEACESIRKITGNTNLAGLSFLDIGCGSGLFSLAALKLGCSNLVSIDIDTDSVNTTKRILNKFYPNGNYRVEKLSVFELNPDVIGQFDIVYSWGVLHHTGDMNNAIVKACSLVKDTGYLCLALYRKTLLCGFWKYEKYFYTKSPEVVKRIIEAIYITLMAIALLVKGESIFARIKQYKSNRGMNYYNDVKDWLGGYPYESVSKESIISELDKQNFKLDKSWTKKPGLGLLGSGCDEYRFKKKQ